MTEMLAAFVALGALALAIIGMRQDRYVALPGRGNAQLLCVFVVVPILVFSLVYVGFRPLWAGFDTEIYLSAYQNLDGPMTAIDVGRRYFGNAEILWWPLQSFVRPFLSPQEWLVANFLAVFFCMLWLYSVLEGQHQVNAWLFALVFLTYFSVYAGNAMRQALSLPIGAAGFCLVVDRRRVGWLPICLSIGLHWSALIFLVAPFLRLTMFEKDWLYFTIPAIGAAISVLFGSIVEQVLPLLGVEALNSKYDLYFAASHVSHVGQVWQTFNFWLCMAGAYGFFAMCRPSRSGSRSLHALVLLATFLVLFGLRAPDVSERYLPLLLLLLPAMAALMLRGVKIAPVAKNAALLLGFVGLGLGVFFSESAQITLGYVA